MEQHIVKIKSIHKVTHDVLQIVTTKPEEFCYSPGQAVEVSINKDGWKTTKRPFTFTSIPANDYLEFNIKTYPLHKSVTNQLLQLNKGNEFILHKTFGTIAYKGEGVFIAGGAGVTPFISILRYLESIKVIADNKLIFANKTKEDIILEQEFKKMLGKNFINILSDEKSNGYASGQITEEFLKANCGGINKMFYLCGPPPMMDAVENQLAELGVEEANITKEEF